MKGTRSPLQFAQVPKDYAGLCRLVTPRPIRDKVDLQNVTRLTDVMARHPLTVDQDDYFDLLCRLIQDYERDQVALAAPKTTGLQALRHLLAEQGMTASDLSRLLGSHRTLGPMILRGERKLTMEHVRILCSRFSVSADLFL